ncbi:NifB/NifX family molybdenum-iron cluster-binding protein [Sedimentibacter sp. zth1]|uniref:NifB/NifX family molybdenum-iron cluster-binding protein n=1 Tax=Sedimentibacter sp. zth1 TaxID=2816908 RepID=UPI001A919B78|nr:NifB/NifX family molybdenum-iron cluster-binding protein [Sedimentibacter sp. zth1]QSX04987.1 NifB/NifX family molybdenum-iron cluster-binding protein [Sedimentibacter sp. zth1]
MIIAIPTDEKNLDSTVCISFGRTPYFAFYDTETKEATYFDNSAISAQGGAGIKASQVIVDKKSAAVLTVRCGENAAAVLNGANVKIYKTIYPTVKENINAFEHNELQILSNIHPGFHNHEK